MIGCTFNAKACCKIKMEVQKAHFQFVLNRTHNVRQINIENIKLFL